MRVMYTRTPTAESLHTHAVYIEVPLHWFKHTHLHIGVYAVTVKWMNE